MGDEFDEFSLPSPTNTHTSLLKLNNPHVITVTNPTASDISPFDVEDDDNTAVILDPHKLAKKNRYILFLIISYILIGTCIVLFNKWMLNILQFTFPITMILVCLSLHSNAFSSSLLFQTHLTCTGTLAVILVSTVYKSRLSLEEYWPSNVSRKSFFTQLVPPGILLG
jgi:hypothetical protein